MLWAIVHRLVVAITILAFVAGMTLQLMPQKAALAADTPMDDCAQMAMPPADAGSTHKAPCKGIDPECIKQMGCVGTPSLPLRLGAAFLPYLYSKVVYSTPAVFGHGRSIKPDLFPPIGR